MIFFPGQVDKSLPFRQAQELIYEKNLDPTRLKDYYLDVWLSAFYVLSGFLLAGNNGSLLLGSSVSWHPISCLSLMMDLVTTSL